jgi:hypothetical protein
LGDRILMTADVVVWLDLPLRVWLPRLVRRTSRRLIAGEEIWNGNRESLHSAVWGRESLIFYALRSHFARRREWPAELSGFPVIRLRTTAGVRAFITGVSRSEGARGS